MHIRPAADLTQADSRAKPITIIPFPPRRTMAVVIVRERDGEGWLTLARGHGWLFGSLVEAVAEAVWLGRNLGLPVRARGGRA